MSDSLTHWRLLSRPSGWDTPAPPWTSPSSLAVCLTWEPWPGWTASSAHTRYSSHCPSWLLTLVQGVGLGRETLAHSGTHGDRTLLNYVIFCRLCHSHKIDQATIRDIFDNSQEFEEHMKETHPDILRHLRPGNWPTLTLYFFQLCCWNFLT